MKYLALICARGGSKGLPGKNIRLLAGKPLIAHAIEQARGAKGIEHVMVSTDSPEIAEVAVKFGAEVPGLRPAELAQDTTPEWLVWRHALDVWKEHAGSDPDAMVSVPATAPLRKSIDIENCLKEFEKGETDIVITMSEAHRSPYFNMVTAREDGSLRLVIPPETAIVRRQDAPVVFDMTTVAYVVSPMFVRNHSGVFEGRVHGVLVPRERALDIDTAYDFQIAEAILAQRIDG